MGRFLCSLLWGVLAILVFTSLSAHEAWANDVTRETTTEYTETVEEPPPAQTAPQTEPAPRADTDVRTTREEVRVEQGTGNYMGVIARNAFFGAVLGGLVGGAGYLISGREWSLWNIAYFAAGGVLVGTAAGFVEVMIRESRAAPTASLEWMERDMPRTVTAPVLRLNF